jgi:hypothetical protein
MGDSTSVSAGAGPPDAPVLQPIDLRKRFLELASTWKKDTRLVSSMTDMILHPAYQQIIGLGRGALPLILEELGRQPDYWFWALFAISGEDPVRTQDQGDLEKMTAAWLSWGKQRGLCDGKRNGS